MQRAGNKTARRLDSPRADFVEIGRTLVTVRLQVGTWRATISVRPRLAKQPEQTFKAAAYQQINQGEKDGGQGGHDKDHNSRQRDLATGRPNHLCDFRADLLYELYRVGSRHIMRLAEL